MNYIRGEVVSNRRKPRGIALKKLNFMLENAKDSLANFFEISNVELMMNDENEPRVYQVRDYLGNTNRHRLYKFKSS
ncbi:hypothetical protein D3C78_1479610 [compost metagenome]